MSDIKEGSLAGLKVLDLGRMVAGPYCAMMLASLGADVLKIEEPRVGDMSRGNLPMQDGVSTYFVTYNCNKSGITINLKSDEGKKILTSLIREADVLIENFRPGVMRRLGFSYDQVKAINPGIVYVSISGYGQDGELATRAAFDPVAQAMSGMVSITGPDSENHVRCGASVADVLAGQNAAFSALAALIHREKTGVGQHIDIALADSCISAMASVNQIYLSTGKVPRPLGNGFEANAPGNCYKTSDGSVMLLAGRDSEWEAFSKALNRPDWLRDPRFTTVHDRVANRKALDEMITEETKKYTTEELMSILLEARLPAGEVNSINQVVASPHFHETRKMFVDVQHPEIGKVTVTNLALHLSDSKCGLDRSAPLLGQDNERVLKSLGYSEEEIRAMEENGII